MLDAECHAHSACTHANTKRGAADSGHVLAVSARSEIELTGEAMEAIGEYYAELRARADESALPITVRTLETLIRLSTAAAKARLSQGARRLLLFLGCFGCRVL